MVLLPQHSSFLASELLQLPSEDSPPSRSSQFSQPSTLWTVLSSGLEETLWQSPACPIHIDTSHSEQSRAATISMNCQGMHSTLTGALSSTTTKFALTWNGRLSHEKDGLLEVSLALSLSQVSQVPESRVKVALNLEILQQKGRIAFLDPRKTSVFWQNVVDDLLAYQVALMQEQWHTYQQQMSSTPTTKKYRWRLIFVLLCVLLFIFFFA